jgi:hypothetical protein
MPEHPDFTAAAPGWLRLAGRLAIRALAVGSLAAAIRAIAPLSWRLDHIRSLNEVRHVAEHSQHFEALTRIRFGPAGVGYEVAHAHKRASDQCGSTFMR